MATSEAYSPPYGTMPAIDAQAITPDNVDLAYVARALYIGVAGNVKVITVAGTSVCFVGAQAGSIIPVQVVQVCSTSTTATNILGLV